MGGAQCLGTGDTRSSVGGGCWSIPWASPCGIPEESDGVSGACLPPSLPQFWQLYNAVTLFELSSHEECREWQVWGRVAGVCMCLCVCVGGGLRKAGPAWREFLPQLPLDSPLWGPVPRAPCYWGLGDLERTQEAGKLLSGLNTLLNAMGGCRGEAVRDPA